ncbi:ScbA/BarX family gamma-butyrolactone biosynthesis protein [Streptomyces sp. NPDC002564]|uniref:ScbA/BarX family gamma-butyrolactone biosynthesis protein n=1 Tax=Streptomyces sp. NPDC002564 TaxID=3364649 RepID=UPI0036CCC42C
MPAAPTAPAATGSAAAATAPANAPTAGASRLTTTVPREYVHRAALAEVFLTSSEKTGEDTYTLTGQWPRAHTFFTTADGRSHDHLQACETLRQTGIYLAHAQHAIPLGHHFVMQDMTVTTHPEHLDIANTPTDLTLYATLTVPRRGTFTIDLVINCGTRTLAIGRGHFTCLSPAAYKRLRAGGAPTSQASGPALPYVPTHQDPAVFGRNLSHDLVLAPAHQPHTWRLNADPRHAILFDHDGDHIPGMVLIEAARQSAHPHLPPNAIPTHTHTEFHRYVELTTPCYITTTPQPQDPTQPHSYTFHVTGHQNNQPTFTTYLTATTHPTP